MVDKKTIWMLNELEGFEKPKIDLEQYATSSELSINMMEMINSIVELDDANLVDIGCGCGMLMTTAATLYEPERVVGIDIDESALTVCRRNLEKANVEEVCELLLLDVLQPDAQLPFNQFDVAVINPPFGTKNNAGIDMKFVQVGIQMVRPGGCVFSLHKTSTRDFILKTAMKWGNVEAECCAEMRWELPATYKFHKKKSVDIAVDLIHFRKKDSIETDNQNA